MTKRKPVLVLTIITAVLFFLAGLFFLISTVFAPASETVAVSFAELNAGIASLFTGGSVGFLIAVIIEAVIFTLIPLIVHLVRKQHSVTIILLIGSLLALYISLFSLGYIATPKIFAYLKAIVDGKDEAAMEKFVKDLGIFFVLSFPLLAAGSLVELATFIVDMCISAKPKEVATAQSAREEAPVEEEPAPAPVEEPKEEEPAPAPAPVEEVKEEEILEPEPEPEVVEEPKQEPQQEPQQTVININVVGVQPAEQPKAEEEKEEKPAPKKAPAKKAAPKKEEKKPAKKEEKKPEPKKASRETQTIKKPAARETQTIKKAEVLTNDEGKQFVKAYHISQRKELKKWQVKGAGSEKAIKLFDTQKEAIDYANELAAKNGAAVRVHSRAGKMRKA